MASFIDVAREYFPDLSDSELDGLIWARTGMPSFWPTRDGESIEDCFRRQLQEYRDAAAKIKPGERMCDWCKAVAEPGKWTCKSCGDALHPSGED